MGEIGSCKQNWFCMTCKSNLCIDCTDHNNKQHSVLNYDSVMSVIQNSCGLQQMKESHTKILSYLDVVKQSCSNYQEKFRKSVDSVFFKVKLQEAYQLKDFQKMSQLILKNCQIRSNNSKKLSSSGDINNFQGQFCPQYLEEISSLSQEGLNSQFTEHLEDLNNMLTNMATIISTTILDSTNKQLLLNIPISQVAPFSNIMNSNMSNNQPQMQMQIINGQQIAQNGQNIKKDIIIPQQQQLMPQQNNQYFPLQSIPNPNQILQTQKPPFQQMVVYETINSIPSYPRENNFSHPPHQGILKAVRYIPQQISNGNKNGSTINPNSQISIKQKVSQLSNDEYKYLVEKEFGILDKGPTKKVHTSIPLNSIENNNSNFTISLEDSDPQNSGAEEKNNSKQRSNNNNSDFQAIQDWNRKAISVNSANVRTKKHHPLVVKQNAVREYKQNNMSIKDIAKKYGVVEETVKHWIKALEPELLKMQLNEEPYVNQVIGFENIQKQINFEGKRNTYLQKINELEGSSNSLPGKGMKQCDSADTTKKDVRSTQGECRSSLSDQESELSNRDKVMKEDIEIDKINIKINLEEQEEQVKKQQEQQQDEELKNDTHLKLNYSLQDPLILHQQPQQPQDWYKIMEQSVNNNLYNNNRSKIAVLSVQDINQQNNNLESIANQKNSETEFQSLKQYQKDVFNKSAEQTVFQQSALKNKVDEQLPLLQQQQNQQSQQQQQQQSTKDQLQQKQQSEQIQDASEQQQSQQSKMQLICFRLLENSMYNNIPLDATIIGLSKGNTVSLKWQSTPEGSYEEIISKEFPNKSIIQEMKFERLSNDQIVILLLFEDKTIWIWEWQNKLNPKQLLEQSHCYSVLKYNGQLLLAVVHISNVTDSNCNSRRSSVSNFSSKASNSNSNIIKIYSIYEAMNVKYEIDTNNEFMDQSQQVEGSISNIIIWNCEDTNRMFIACNISSFFISYEYNRQKGIFELIYSTQSEDQSDIFKLRLHKSFQDTHEVIATNDTGFLYVFDIIRKQQLSFKTKQQEQKKMIDIQVFRPQQQKHSQKQNDKKNLQIQSQVEPKIIMCYDDFLRIRSLKKLYFPQAMRCATLEVKDNKITVYYVIANSDLILKHSINL